MSSRIRRFFRSPFSAVDQRFDHADRRLVDSVDTVVRHTDIRFGEASASADGRHSEMLDAISRVHGELDITTSSMVESTAYLGRALRELRAVIEGSTVDLGERVASLRRGLVNQPGRSGGAAVAVPYALRAIARVPAGSSVLVAGNGGLAGDLAALGYHVTALDRSETAPGHPFLAAAPAGLAGWSPDEPFDSVVALDLIGRLGSEVYDDAEATAALRRVVGPRALLVLSAPFGRPEAGHPRAYDKAGLDRLLDGWDIDDCTIAAQIAPAKWVIGPGAAEDDSRIRQALITARVA